MCSTAIIKPPQGLQFNEKSGGNPIQLNTALQEQRLTCQQSCSIHGSDSLQPHTEQDAPPQPSCSKTNP